MTQSIELSAQVSIFDSSCVKYEVESTSIRKVYWSVSTQVLSKFAHIAYCHSPSIQTVSNMSSLCTHKHEYDHSMSSDILISLVRVCLLGQTPRVSDTFTDDIHPQAAAHARQTLVTLCKDANICANHGSELRSFLFPCFIADTLYKRLQCKA